MSQASSHAICISDFPTNHTGGLMLPMLGTPCLKTAELFFVCCAATSTRERSKRKEAATAMAKAVGAQEQEFLNALSMGVGGGIDPLVLADQVAKLKAWSMSDRKKLINGDWQLHASDAGDLLVQFGSGLHGLPFMDVKEMYMSLRPKKKLICTVEILQLGPARNATTILKGTFRERTEDAILEYEGIVDEKGNRPALMNNNQGTRQMSVQTLYVGLRILIFRVAPTDSRKGGFVIFRRE
eukprot:CAMPEP_0172817970 /NCGR_PEP_ID=MMETSP1075-20121228/13610_1 /TAXON_ID=2916 /ORGANISM="Ceratium fusus, Strain PA161109" /LENGTH=239 /DNA_ID=CAMNT_0013658281 /DNA_START=43 /DNA_END=760 /DNA_ORIENTATION=-